jgi:hypothetical protein
MSTPASDVKLASPLPSAAPALESREPSMCSTMPASCTWSAIARTSSGVYSVPSSVVWVMLTASGWARCSSPHPQASRSMSSGMSLPSGVCTGSSLSPVILSGAPPSSVWMWALALVTTAPHLGSRLVSAVTFAPVPLNTGNASARSPK